MATLEELLVELDLDADDFDSGLDRTVSGAEKKLDKLGNSFDKGIGGGVDRSTSKLAVLGTSFGLMQSDAMTKIGLVTGALAALPLVTQVAASGMGAAFGAGIAGIGLMAAAQADDVQDRFSELKETVSSDLQEMAEPFEATLISAADTAESVFKELSPNLEGAFEQLAPTITSFTDSIGDAFETWGPTIDAATDLFDDILKDLEGPLGDQIRELGDNLKTLFENADSETFAGLIEDVAGFVNRLIEFADWINNNQELMTVLSTLFIALSVGILIAAAAIWVMNLALFASPITWIILGIMLLIAVIILIIIYWDEIAAAVGEAWDFIVRKLKQAWNWIKSTAKSVWEGIVQFFADTWNSITSTASDAWEGLKTTVSDGVDTAVSFVQELPGKITDAVGDLGSLLWDAGSDIISGLIDGVQSKIGDLRGKFNEVTGMIPDWKGPESTDLKLLRPAGQDTMTGYERGIEDQIPDVRSTLEGFTADMGRMAGSGAGRGQRQGGTMGRVVLDVTGADEEMKTLIRKMVRVDGGGDVDEAFGREGAAA